MQPTQQNSSKLVYLITAVLVIGAAIYYFYYSGDTSVTDSESSLSAQDASTSAIGQNVLILLNEIHSLQIDTKFFQGPVYNSFVDYSVAIPTVDVGRVNPFSPFSTSTPSAPETPAVPTDASSSGQ